MSHQSSSSSSYVYTSSTSTTSNQPSTHTTSQTTHSTYNDSTGGHTERVTQETGQPTVVERTSIPAGRYGVADSTAPTQGRIEDVTGHDGGGERKETDEEIDRRYREAMEDEYAKREGGA